VRLLLRAGATAQLRVGTAAQLKAGATAALGSRGGAAVALGSQGGAAAALGRSLAGRCSGSAGVAASRGGAGSRGQGEERSGGCVRDGNRSTSDGHQAFILGCWAVFLLFSRPVMTLFFNRPGHHRAMSFIREFFLYFLLDFRKINGRTKNFEKYTSGAKPYGGWVLPPRGQR
jgi:hypothetical protein